MPTIEIPASEAVEQQVIAANFAGGLAADPVLGASCIAECVDLRGMAPPPSMLAYATLVWRTLSDTVLPAAVPFYWTVGATRNLHALARGLDAQARIGDTLPAPTGWWWLGYPGVVDGLSAALAWRTDDRGVEFYPFDFITHRWRSGGLKGQRYRLGPMSAAGFRVDPGKAWSRVGQEQWSALGADGRRGLEFQLQLLTAGCTALASGELIATPVPVESSEHARIAAEFPNQAVPSTVHIVTVADGRGKRS